MVVVALPLVAGVPKLCFHAPIGGRFRARDVITNQKMNSICSNICELVLYLYHPLKVDFHLTEFSARAIFST